MHPGAGREQADWTDREMGPTQGRGPGWTRGGGRGHTTLGLASSEMAILPLEQSVTFTPFRNPAWPPPTSFVHGTTVHRAPFACQARGLRW